MAFRVGQKVVCVNGTFIDATWNWIPLKPVEGLIYTVRRADVCPFGWPIEMLPALWLAEIVNPPLDWEGITTPIEMGFWAERFRPVVERKTDISIFTAMLNPSKQTVDAR